MLYIQIKIKERNQVKYFSAFFCVSVSLICCILLEIKNLKEDEDEESIEEEERDQDLGENMKKR